MGQSARTSDCIRSLSKWQKLSDRMTAQVVPMAAAPAGDDTVARWVAPDAIDPSPIATA
jgi:hypothetical protein